jgi:hypothetical protein
VSANSYGGGRAGTVVTVDIDAKANAFAVQHHSPDLPDAKRTNGGEGHRWTPSALSAAALLRAQHIGLSPVSGVVGPIGHLELEASDEFPLWARVDKAVVSAK